MQYNLWPRSFSFFTKFIGFIFVPLLDFGTSEQQESVPVPPRIVLERKMRTVISAQFFPVPSVPFFTYKNENLKEAAIYRLYTYILNI